MNWVESSYCAAVVIFALLLTGLIAIELYHERPTGWIDFPAYTSSRFSLWESR